VQSLFLEYFVLSPVASAPAVCMVAAANGNAGVKNILESR
jgi:hypothetical protein